MARPKQNNDDQPKAALTPDQRSIAERVANQETDWFSIGEESMNDFSMMNNPLNLDPNYPVAARLEREKKYVFRWCERTPSRVDALTRSVAPPQRWAIVNRQTLPEMADSVDPILGCVCCLDQMLLFKPYSHAMMVWKAKNEMAEARANSPKQKVQGEKIEVSSGPQNKITGSDIVEYQDDRSDLGDLVVDE